MNAAYRNSNYVKNSILFKEILGKDYVIDNYNKDVINQLWLYYHNKKGKLDLKKSIILYGSVGHGKTYLISKYAEYLDKTDNPHAFRLKSSFRQMGQKYKDYGRQPLKLDMYSNVKKTIQEYVNNNTVINRHIFKCDYFFDDLGIEWKKYMHMGSSIDVAEEILEQLYEGWKNNGTQTIIATQLTPAEIEMNYADSRNKKHNRLLSRIYEQYQYLHLDGFDRRLTVKERK